MEAVRLLFSPGESSHSGNGCTGDRAVCTSTVPASCRRACGCTDTRAGHAVRAAVAIAKRCDVDGDTFDGLSRADRGQTKWGYGSGTRDHLWDAWVDVHDELSGGNQRRSPSRCG